MSKKKRFGVSEALTRGLSDTISVVENNAGIFRNVVLPLSRIELDPENPRKLAISLMDIQQGLNKDDVFYNKKAEELEKLTELSHTIQSSGVINPIVVYKRAEFYRIVAGERRCLASILAGKNEIEARVFNEKPRGFELKLIQWIENTAREDLSLEERVGNIKDMVREYQHQHHHAAVTATTLKNITGLSLPQATYYLAVMEAPQDVQKMIEEGKIRSLDKAAIISGIESVSLRHEALQACANGCSLKDLRSLIAKGKKTDMLATRHANSVKRGRSVTKVNMGSTMNLGVVQTIIDSVLHQSKFKKYSDIFSEIHWGQIDQVNRAFRKLIEILEHETAG